jgi:hypothetical protein
MPGRPDFEVLQTPNYIVVSHVSIPLNQVVAVVSQAAPIRLWNAFIRITHATNGAYASGVSHVNGALLDLASNEYLGVTATVAGANAANSTEGELIANGVVPVPFGGLYGFNVNLSAVLANTADSCDFNIVYSSP